LGFENRTHPEAKKSILVIDDDASILRVFTRVLEKRGFLVATAKSGREAWEKVRTKSFDATLIDVGLPDMDGTELMRRMGDLPQKWLRLSSQVRNCKKAAWKLRRHLQTHFY